MHVHTANKQYAVYIMLANAYACVSASCLFSESTLDDD
jgi:hypothetical protein